MKFPRFLVLATFIAIFLMPTLVVPRMTSAQEISDQDKKMMEMMAKYGTPGIASAARAIALRAAVR
jgi:hypothetical protein